MKEEKVMLSDEEMNNVAGGVTFICELVHGKYGDYVHLNRQDTTGKSIVSDHYQNINKNLEVPVENFDKYVQRLKERHGEVTLVGTDGKPFALPQ